MNQSGINIVKDPMKNKLHSEKSSFAKYKDFFAGSVSFKYFFLYELYILLFSLLPGAVGLFLRKKCLPFFLCGCGKNALWGRDLQIRHPKMLSVGKRVAIDDHCLLDARSGIRIGDDAIIARDCILLAKTGEIVMGDRCAVGSQSHISSTAGVIIGNDVGIGGQCYIGGGLYRTERLDVPMMQQELYSRGPVLIGNDVWIGAGSRILDGVKIGNGVFVGAGAVISENVPAYSKMLPYQKLVSLPRGGASEKASAVSPTTKSETHDQDLRRRVMGCCVAAIDEVNRQLPPQERLTTDEATVLFDSVSGDGLDSHGLINFIVISEQRLEEEFGRAVNLASEAEGSSEITRFARVSKLVDFITAKLERGN